MRSASQRMISRSFGPERAQSRRAGEVEGKTVVIIVLATVVGLSLIVCAGMVLLMLPAVQSARNVARVTQSQNNLRQIGLALHNYHDTIQTFPPGGVHSADGTAYHSWQTMLLPYVGQAPLYNAIDFDRPWTDPVNASLFATNVPVFLNPLERVRGGATGGAPSHYAGNSQVLFENSSISLKDVTDGTSNTIFAGEVGAGYRAWGDPQNVRDPADGIGSNATTFGNPDSSLSCEFLMMDGSARTISSDIDPDVLKALATPNGGEEVPSDF